ncbi:MAG: alpha-hydroxy-acid oxidizing protein [Pseudomonadota bacterium]|nr:alpha-hydroxy-acid oxidizing protein [Pseudomonadota bacterium]
MQLSNCLNIADLREAARRRLPRGVFDYLDKGTEDQVALQENRDAFERRKLLNRVMVPLKGRELGTVLFGKPIGLPLVIAPTGLAGLCWFEGEMAVARSAAAAKIPFTLATGATTAMERIVGESGAECWFQVYMWADRAKSFQLVKRARSAGFRSLVVTVDFALGANREHNKRNGFITPFKLNPRAARDVALHPRWLLSVLGRHVVKYGAMPRNENFPDDYRATILKNPMERDVIRNETMEWEDLRRLRDVWPETLIVKGIIRPDDAERAVEYGADGIVVSNHGGRNMDSACASLDALPAVVKAVGGGTTIMLDSGIRRGSDLVKALALGAQAVMVGRAPLYGVAAGGQAGSDLALKLLRTEFEKTMAYVGCRTVGEIGEDVLA